MREIEGVVKGKGAKKGAKEVVWACESGIREMKERVVGEAPGGPGEGGWERGGGIGTIGFKEGWIWGIRESAGGKVEESGKGLDKGSEGSVESGFVCSKIAECDIMEDGGGRNVDRGKAGEREGRGKGRRGGRWAGR